MKSLGFVSASALLLLGLATTQPAHAQAAGGTYRFQLDDGLTKSLEFDASTDSRGITTGAMTFTDPARIPDVDDPEDPRAGDAPPEFTIKASLSSLTVEKNRAVMNGVVRDSTHKSYIGRWVQLVVEDNVENLRVPDQVTWTFCVPQQSRGWIPSDAEVKDDDGAFLRWWATDAERKDDVGIPSVDLVGSGEVKSCAVYPPSWYTFTTLQKWEGDIFVKQ
jgi:hypothetical protein